MFDIKFPHLVTYAKRTNQSVWEVISQEFLHDMFHLPLSQQAFNEFEILEDICQNAMITAHAENKDSWSYIWGNSEFTTKNAYNVMIGQRHMPEIFSWIWKSACQAKYKFFFWMVLLDRLNTRNFLARKLFNIPSYNCATLQCSQAKTLIHMF
jgi:hypothetical protein